MVDYYYLIVLSILSLYDTYRLEESGTHRKIRNACCVSAKTNVHGSRDTISEMYIGYKIVSVVLTIDANPSPSIDLESVVRIYLPSLSGPTIDPNGTSVGYLSDHRLNPPSFVPFPSSDGQPLAPVSVTYYQLALCVMVWTESPDARRGEHRHYF